MPFRRQSLLPAAGCPCREEKDGSVVLGRVRPEDMDDEGRDRAKREGIEKIKTIGDAYMAAVGLTESAENDGAVRMVNFVKGVMKTYFLA